MKILIASLLTSMISTASLSADLVQREITKEQNKFFAKRLLDINNWTQAEIHELIEGYERAEEILLENFADTLIYETKALPMNTSRERASFFISYETINKNAFYASADAAKNISHTEDWDTKWNINWLRAREASESVNDNILWKTQWYRIISNEENTNLNTIDNNMRKELALFVYEGTRKAVIKLDILALPSNANKLLTNLYTLAAIGQSDFISNNFFNMFNSLMSLNSHDRDISTMEINNFIDRYLNNNLSRENSYIKSLNKILTQKFN